jgi:hypothetical protein
LTFLTANKDPSTKKKQSIDGINHAVTNFKISAETISSHTLSAADAGMAQFSRY